MTLSEARNKEVYNKMIKLRKTPPENIYGNIINISIEYIFFKVSL